MEYKFFSEPPYHTELKFFQDAPHVPPGHQIGHAERTKLVYLTIVDFLRKNREVEALVDLGCGDGALLGQLSRISLRTYGYEAGAENIAVARAAGLDVRYADILNDELQFPDLSVCCEVLEHLYDPKSFLERITSKFLIISSPSAETDEWHYLEHSWGWDLEGYRQLAISAGWHVLKQKTVTAAGVADFLGNGDVRHPEFQVLVAKRD